MTDTPTPTPAKMHDDQFAGQVAIVTGAHGGVGRALTALFLARGARVVAQDVEPGVKELQDSDPDHVAPVVGDVAESEVARLCVATAVKRFGRLDVLVNNAGRTLNKPVTETSDEDWDRIMWVNARGSFVQSREAFRHLREHGGGSIVAVGSYAMSVALPTGSAYAASKGAIAQLTKVLAVEGAPYAIRANAVAAGVIDTGFLNDTRPDGQEYLQTFGSAHPLGRIAQPEEIAEAVLWLASGRAGFVTGAILPVDGGFTAQ